jgi:hypothetical protein
MKDAAVFPEFESAIFDPGIGSRASQLGRRGVGRF